jgi:antitoxin MazE
VAKGVSHGGRESTGSGLEVLERPAASELHTLSGGRLILGYTCVYFLGTGHDSAEDEETIMLTRVQKWGNSQGVRFPTRLLQEADIAVGDEVDISVEKGRIVVEPSQRIRGKYRLEELLARMPEDYEPSEENWGEPVGREVW